MTATTLAPAPAPVAAELAIDPVQARAEFFLELELLELRVTIPQAAPAAAVARY